MLYLSYDTITHNGYVIWYSLDSANAIPTSPYASYFTILSKVKYLFWNAKIIQINIKLCHLSFVSDGKNKSNSKFVKLTIIDADVQNSTSSYTI